MMVKFILLVSGLLASSVDAAIVWTKPTLTDSSYVHATAIAENTAVGTTILTVAADDAAVNTGAVAYSIVAPATTLFQVDGTSGEISLKTALDYETAKSHTIQVEAKKGSTSSGTATITFSVGNIKEPAFAQPTQVVCVQEIPSGDAAITTVSATVDGNTDASTTYTISETAPQTAKGLFEIKPATTGAVKKVTGKSVLKDVSTYTLKIKASSGGATALITVTINVGDCSDASIMISSLSLLAMMVFLVVSMH